MSVRSRWLGSILWLLACDDGGSSAPTQTPASAEATKAETPAEGEAEASRPGGLAAEVAAQVDRARAGETSPSPPEPQPKPEEEGPTLAEVLAGADPPPEARTRPRGLLAPTPEEFEAWDRKDPAAETALYEWDEEHLDPMLEHATDLQCFRHRMVAAGAGLLDGSLPPSEWAESKREQVRALETWLTELLTDDPRIIERSKLVGNFLEAHELVLSAYPKAFDDGGGVALDKAEAHWMVVQAKMRKYVEKLGGRYPEASAADCERREAAAR